MQNNDIEGEILGLDIGESRIGVARAHTIAKLPEPLEVIDVTKQNSIQAVMMLIEQTSAQLIVVGLPLLESGDDSEQTTKVRQFIKQLSELTDVPFVFVDEAYSSQDADDYIKRSGTHFVNNDSVAACIILERYFESKEK